MARNQTHIGASPERIFEVLSDPDSYGYWVVGSERIRGAEPDFPKRGARFHHTVGFGPFKINDHTQVLDLDPPRLLKLRARARPLGTAHVTLEIEPEGDGSRVTMIEDPGDAMTSLVFNPLTHLLVRRRNVKSLDRLRELAEGSGEHPDKG
ncbi:MAG TPA: SRPBCC family protein [Solirubrobacterales bacterium]|nr:SRPBCC family protein [Solirubrobacterales bacterium]